MDLWGLLKPLTSLIRRLTMVFPFRTKYNGIYYDAGQEIPVEETKEEKVAETVVEETVEETKEEKVEKKPTYKRKTK